MFAPSIGDQFLIKSSFQMHPSPMDLRTLCSSFFGLWWRQIVVTKLTQIDSLFVLHLSNINAKIYSKL
ncbi:hypothetical protein QR98_0090980 [Sarcoptes scabiei]|uniref:Uncharacterized protein n=1 Tax=Sarcoptes scabiei TaxID=52283 RepID=A0A132AJB0_SARSC|nr:hypothetical protein QR98_0090980 [Sarcoptes scabiei]